MEPEESVVPGPVAIAAEYAQEIGATVMVSIERSGCPRSVRVSGVLSASAGALLAQAGFVKEHQTWVWRSRKPT